MADPKLPPSIQSDIDRFSNYCQQYAPKGSDKYYSCMTGKSHTRSELRAYDPEDKNLGSKLRDAWRNRKFDYTPQQTLDNLLKPVIEEVLPVEETREAQKSVGQMITAAQKGDLTMLGAGAIGLGTAAAEGVFNKTVGRYVPKSVKKSAKNNKGKGKVEVKKDKKKREELKCGEGGTYQALKRKLAQIVGFERDHVPSSAALKKRALELNRGKKLTDTQLRKIANVGHTLAIPEGVHMNYSLTYKSLNNKTLIAKDAGNLQKAAKRDLRAIKKGLDKGCKKRYEAYAKKIRKITNQEYDAMLTKALQGK